MDTVDTAREDVENSANWLENTWNDITGLFSGIDGPLELIVAVVVVVVVIGGIIAAISNFVG